MEEFVTAVTILLIGASICAFRTWRKLKDAERLKEWVAWSVSESDSARCNIPIWAHLKNAQNHANIRDEYRITGEEEWETAKEIIGRYQRNLCQSYFNGLLWIPKSKYVIQDKDYFVYMLYVYLCEHDRYEKDIVFHKMHYISYMYCNANPSLQGNVPAWSESGLKEILDDDLTKKHITN